MSELLFAVYAYSQEDSDITSVWIKNVFMEIIKDMLDRNYSIYASIHLLSSMVMLPT